MALNAGWPSGKKLYQLYSPHNLRLIAWLVLVVGLTATGLFWLRLNVNHEQLRADTLEQASHRAEQLAAVQAHQIETLLFSIDLALCQFRDAAQSGDWVAAQRGAGTVFKSFAPHALDHFSVVDASGHIVHSTGALTGSVYVGDRDFFKFHQHVPTDQLHINQPVFGRTTASWLILLTRPLYKHGRFAGVAAVALNAEYLADSLARLSGTSSDTMTLFYANGAYMARSHGFKDVMGKSVPRDRPFLQPGTFSAGSRRSTAFADNTNRIYGWARLNQHPLVLSVGLDEAALLAPIDQQIRRGQRQAVAGTAVVLSLCLLVIGMLAAAERQQIALASSEIVLRLTLDSTEEGILVIDGQDRVLVANAQFRVLWQLPATHPGASVVESLWGHLLSQVSNVQALLTTHQGTSDSTQAYGDILRLKDNRFFEYNTRAFMLRGAMARLWSFRDITERKRAELENRLAASVFVHSHEGIMITDDRGAIADVNPAFTRITGYTKDEVLGRKPQVLAAGLNSRRHYAAMWSVLSQQGFWRGEMWNRRKNGELFTEMLALSVVRDEQGRARNYIGVFSDISQLKQHEAQLDRAAYFDALTEVPNRRLLADRLKQAIVRGHRSGRMLAVCYLDLDGFKPINDECGHDMGDRLLVEITRRLQSMLRAEDTLARLGGDEFVLLLSDLSRAQECFDVLDRVLVAVSVPMMLDHGSVSISASIGVTLFPPDEGEADSLLRHADQAMYRAKEAGKNRYFLFDPDQDRQVKAQRHQLQQLRQAFKLRQLVLHYQPKVDLLTGDIVGAEALIRWQHPERGLLLPASFLSVLFDSDLEIEVGEWVIESALAQTQIWRDAGLDLVVSANVSANHLLSNTFTQRLSALLNRHQTIPANRLELEILESAALSDVSVAVDTLSHCHAMGVRFALDDFGTGYSSLAYFRRLPVDILKIDQSFVRGMLADADDLEIVESVVRLAQAFRRPVIAEGVETLAHGALLVTKGCHYVQGFGIGRPMAPEALPDWIRQWRHDQVWTNLQDFYPADVPRLQSDVPPLLVI